MSPSDVVRLVRGEKPADPRPSKAPSPERYNRLLQRYAHRELVIDIAQSGIQPDWNTKEPSQGRRPKNHASSQRYSNAVTRSIRAGQDAGQYLVVEARVLRLWPQTQISPLGAVEKKGVSPREEVRLIHDLSYPTGASTNEHSCKDHLPCVRYGHVAAIAKRIEFCHARYPGRRIKLLKRDVKGAFRHLMLHAAHVKWMAALVTSSLVVDLSAPFGWTASPAFYGVFGGAISWLLGHESPASMDPDSCDPDCFFAYEWVDDHILVEPDQSTRLHWAEQTLRLAMLAILGHRAINEEKFSQWSINLQVLGLQFDTVARTVSMRQDKIDKAIGRVQQIRQKRATTRQEPRKLLGSLRHVCSCLRAAKPFYQRIQSSTSAASKHGNIVVDDKIRADLDWLYTILRHGTLRSLPTSMSGQSPPVHAHFYLDASNVGLAVLDPARRRYIQVKFSPKECYLIQHDDGPNGFNINVREQFCIALVALLFAPEWCHFLPDAVLQLKVWSDNTAAVAWTNKLASKNEMSQNLNRAIGIAEAVNNCRVAAAHLPGASNFMADAGSRAWTPKFADLWTNCSASWTRVQVPESARLIYCQFSSVFNPTLWPNQQKPSTRRRGDSGADGVTSGACLSGSLQTSSNTHNSSCYLQSSAGAVMRPVGKAPTMPPPYCPNSAISHGVIREIEDTKSVSTKDTSWRCEECSGCHHHQHEKSRSTSASSGDSGVAATSKTPTTAFFGGCDHGLLLSPTKIGVPKRRETDEELRDLIPARSRASAASVRIRFRGIKTNQTGAGATRTQERSGSSWTCPVLALWELVDLGLNAGIPISEPVCTVAPGETLASRSMSAALKQATASTGQDPDKYGTHSLRSGGATALFTAGVDRLAIKLFGRWSSDSFEIYTRLDGLTLSQLAAKVTFG